MKCASRTEYQDALTVSESAAELIVSSMPRQAVAASWAD